MLTLDRAVQTSARPDAPLWERHRPWRFQDVVGQEKALTELQRATGGHYGGRAYWLSGKSGTGKTTVARILALQVADPDMVEEWDAQELTPPRVQELTRTLWRATGLFGRKHGRAAIVNEAHGLTAGCVRAFLSCLEPIPPLALVVFTTTAAGQQRLFDGGDGRPLASRCTRLELSQRGIAEPFAARAKAVAQAAGLDGRPLEAYVQLAHDCKGSLRDMLERIERGAMLP